MRPEEVDGPASRSLPRSEAWSTVPRPGPTNSSPRAHARGGPQPMKSAYSAITRLLSEDCCHRESKHTAARLASQGRLPGRRRGSLGGLAQPSVTPSSLGRGDHFGDAALGVAGEQRPDVFSHPRSTNLTRHAIRVLRRRELKDQDQVRSAPRFLQSFSACSPAPECHPLQGAFPHSLAHAAVVPPQRAPAGGGIESWRQMARAVPIGISRWRGTGARRSSVALCQIACLAPSRGSSQPCSMRWRSSCCRLTRRRGRS